MAQVANSTLVWLWEQLQQYSQARVAYNDVAAALANFPSLQPRTDTYHFESGRPALLVCLSGTIPVDFRGRQYRYPVELWVPQEYGQPGAGIICYVRPSAGQDSAPGMMVRPGQHVAVDGRIYHPYLRDWGVQQRPSIVEFLQILQTVFAKEPPIVAVTQPRQAIPMRPSATPAVPPKRQSIDSPRLPPTLSDDAPPPLPSKPGQKEQPPIPSSSSRPYDGNGPPLPPLPPGALPHQRQSSDTFANGHATPQPRLRTNGAPPLPIKHQGPPFSPAQPYSQGANGAPSPISPISPIHRAELPAQKYDRPGPLPQGQSRPSPGPQYSGPPQQQIYHQQQYQHQRQASIPRSAPPPQQYQQQLPQHQRYPSQQYANAPPPQQPKSAAPAPDLLTDPFDISLVAPAQTGPAPPIPPNPEKEHLLTLLSASLTSLAASRIAQSQSALQPLTTQRHALLSAHATMQSEIAQLQNLDRTLTNNERILHQSIRDCNALIESSRKMPQPNIDEVLVAPTVAAQQLWNLCAEEAAIREALWCLQRAVGAGRVGGAEFVRSTRALAREAFLKMALARKVARGLGLDVKGG
ncbi:UEV domain-containing protein [Elsinoe fawcettii]|nr:UEV domain-containing protein [Elsinoe fawcettii]